MWAMRRIGALPSVLGRTHRKWKSPHIAALAIYYGVKHPHRITNTAKVFLQDALSGPGAPHLPHQGEPEDSNPTLPGPTGI